MSIVGYYSNVPDGKSGKFYLVVGFWNAAGAPAQPVSENEIWEGTLQRCDPELLKLVIAAHSEFKKFNLVISNSDIDDDLVLDMEGRAFDLEDESGGAHAAQTYAVGFVSIHFPYEDSEDDEVPELESNWSNAPQLKAIADYVQKKYRPVDELFDDQP